MTGKKMSAKGAHFINSTKKSVKTQTRYLTELRGKCAEARIDWLDWIIDPTDNMKYGKTEMLDQEIA
jgi:hypothetical protein